MASSVSTSQTDERSCSLWHLFPFDGQKRAAGRINFVIESEKYWENEKWELFGQTERRTRPNSFGFLRFEWEKETR